MRKFIAFAVLGTLLSVQPVHAKSIVEKAAEHTVTLGAALGCISGAALSVFFFRKESHPFLTCGLAGAGGSAAMWELSRSESDTPVNRMKQIREINSAPVAISAKSQQSGSAR